MACTVGTRSSNFTRPADSRRPESKWSGTAVSLVVDVIQHFDKARSLLTRRRWSRSVATTINIQRARRSASRPEKTKRTQERTDREMRIPPVNSRYVTVARLQLRALFRSYGTVSRRSQGRRERVFIGRPEFFLTSSR